MATMGDNFHKLAQTTGRMTAPNSNEVKADQAKLGGIRATVGGASSEIVTAAISLPIALAVIAIFVIDNRRD